jgi:hypothetical protein
MWSANTTLPTAAFAGACSGHIWDHDEIVDVEKRR